MATHPLKSMFGKLVGLTRPTTTFTTERLFAKGGFIGPAIYLSTAEGSETAVNIQGFTDVQTSSTGTAALAVRGITLLTSGASTTYTLAAPPAAGIRKTIATGGNSTLVRQILSASPIVVGAASSSIGADGSVITGSTSMTLMTFYQLGQVIELVSLSTAAWVNTSLRGFTSTNSVPFTS